MKAMLIIKYSSIGMQGTTKLWECHNKLFYDWKTSTTFHAMQFKISYNIIKSDF